MLGLNVIWVSSPTADKVLMCKRHKEPYKGFYNLVGGKIKAGEDGMTAAYRELREERNITDSDIELVHLMDFTYFHHPLTSAHFNADNCRVEVYVGKLKHDVSVHGDEKELVWIDTAEDFFDMRRFAREGNIGHIFEIIKRNRKDVL